MDPHPSSDLTTHPSPSEIPSLPEVTRDPDDRSSPATDSGNISLNSSPRHLLSPPSTYSDLIKRTTAWCSDFSSSSSSLSQTVDLIRSLLQVLSHSSSPSSDLDSLSPIDALSLCSSFKVLLSDLSSKLSSTSLPRSSSSIPSAYCALKHKYEYKLTFIDEEDPSSELEQTRSLLRECHEYNIDLDSRFRLLHELSSSVLSKGEECSNTFAKCAEQMKNQGQKEQKKDEKEQKDREALALLLSKLITCLKTMCEAQNERAETPDEFEKAFSVCLNTSALHAALDTLIENARLDLEKKRSYNEFKERLSTMQQRIERSEKDLKKKQQENSHLRSELERLIIQVSAAADAKIAFDRIRRRAESAEREKTLMQRRNADLERVLDEHLHEKERLSRCVMEAREECAKSILCGEEEKRVMEAKLEEVQVSLKEMRERCAQYEQTIDRLSSHELSMLSALSHSSPMKESFNRTESARSRSALKVDLDRTNEDIVHEQGLATIDQLRLTLEEERASSSKLRQSTSTLIRRVEITEKTLADITSVYELAHCEFAQREQTSSLALSEAREKTRMLEEQLSDSTERNQALMLKERMVRKLFQVMERKYLDVLMEKKMLCELPLFPSKNAFDIPNPRKRWRVAFAAILAANRFKLRFKEAERCGQIGMMRKLQKRVQARFSSCVLPMEESGEMSLSLLTPRSVVNTPMKSRLEDLL